MLFRFDGTGFEHAKVYSGRDTTTYTYGSYLAFYTEGKNSGTTDTSTERARIDSSGNFMVGKTSAVTKIETVGAGIDGTGTVSVGTTATTIYTIQQTVTGAMCVVFGDDGSNGFMDIVFFLTSTTPQVVTSKTMYGSPAARTYTASTTALKLALASGTLSVRTAALSTLST